MKPAPAPMLAAAALVLAAGHAAAQAAPPATYLLGMPYALQLRSQQGARFAATLRQQYDFSCGSAALATLLTFHYGSPVSEDDVFEEMFRLGEPERIRAAGFSLLDMKQYLARRGFAADGFELPLATLAEARLPAIVLIRENGYQHFVVVKGLRADRVLIGDPASGTRAVARSDFERAWTSRLLFVIHNRQWLATFDAAADWQHHPAAPLAQGVPRDSLGALAMPRLGVHEN